MVELNWIGVGNVRLFSHGEYTGSVRGDDFDGWSMYVFRLGQSVTPYGGVRTYQSQCVAEQSAAKTVEADMIARGELEPEKPAVECDSERTITTVSVSDSPTTELQWQQIGAIHVAVATRAEGEKPVTFLICALVDDQREDQYDLAIYCGGGKLWSLDGAPKSARTVEVWKRHAQKAWDRYCEPTTQPMMWSESHAVVNEIAVDGRYAIFWFDGKSRTWQSVLALKDGVTREAWAGSLAGFEVRQKLEKIIRSDLK